MSRPYVTIDNALAMPRSTHFGVEYAEGTYRAKDEVSFFAEKLPDAEATFDISNNKALANVAMDGTIKFVSIYHGIYYADTIPGVWVCKDFRRTGPFGFRIRHFTETIELGTADVPYATSLLDNVLPVTTYDLGPLEATVLTFAPVSADGSIRLRGIIYGIRVSNRSQQPVRGEILLPAADVEADKQFSGAELCVHLAEQEQKESSVAFELAAGETLWVPAVIYPLGEATLQQVDAKGSLYWLNETLAYFRSMTGHLEMPEDPFAAAFFERSVFQCFHSIGMDGSGGLTGSNWGSYPTTEYIWSKDMYYSFLPMAWLEPNLYREGMLWFLAHGVRPFGNRFVGGVRHSLSNSLSSVVMAGLYYQSTGDKQFFVEHASIDQRFRKLLADTLQTRQADDPWLFPSLWLSDAYSLGDFHTGSNIIAWAAFHHYARVVEEVYGDAATAAQYRQVAAEIRQAIEHHNAFEGVFGPQYLEGSSRQPDKRKDTVAKYEGAYADLGMQFIQSLITDGQIDLVHHDGEESDTILMPVYGYTDYDDPIYRNYMHFSLHSANPTYNSESRGIQWGTYSACTFPGYMNGMGAITDAASMSGDAGYLTEIRRLTDVDGSLWWWPYGNGARYGEVMRHNTCGKCGWASGVFATMFVTQILGLTYDAPGRQLWFRPFSPSSSFQWEDFRLGGLRLSAAFAGNEPAARASLTNHGPETVMAHIELPAEGSPGRHATLNGRDLGPATAVGQWRDKATDIWKVTLAPGETIRIGAA